MYGNNQYNGSGNKNNRGGSLNSPTSSNQPNSPNSSSSGAPPPPPNKSAPPVPQKQSIIPLSSGHSQNQPFIQQPNPYASPSNPSAFGNPSYSTTVSSNFFKSSDADIAEEEERRARATAQRRNQQPTTANRASTGSLPSASGPKLPNSYTDPSGATSGGSFTRPASGSVSAVMFGSPGSPGSFSGNQPLDSNQSRSGSTSSIGSAMASPMISSNPNYAYSPSTGPLASIPSNSTLNATGNTSNSTPPMSSNSNPPNSPPTMASPPPTSPASPSWGANLNKDKTNYSAAFRFPTFGTPGMGGNQGNFGPDNSGNNPALPMNGAPNDRNSFSVGGSRPPFLNTSGMTGGSRISPNSSPRGADSSKKDSLNRPYDSSAQNNNNPSPPSSPRPFSSTSSNSSNRGSGTVTGISNPSPAVLPQKIDKSGPPPLPISSSSVLPPGPASSANFQPIQSNLASNLVRGDLQRSESQGQTVNYAANSSTASSTVSLSMSAASTSTHPASPSLNSNSDDDSDDEIAESADSTDSVSLNKWRNEHNNANSAAKLPHKNAAGVFGQEFVNYKSITKDKERAAIQNNSFEPPAEAAESNVAKIAPTLAKSPSSSAKMQESASKTDGTAVISQAKQRCSAEKCAAFAVRNNFCLRHQWKADYSSQKALQVAHELLSSERTYLEGLKVLNFSYYKRLNQAAAMEKPILQREEVEKLFHNIGDIYALSEALFTDLEEVALHGQLNNYMAAILTHYALQFRMYQSYVENYDAATKLLADIRASGNKEFDAFCKITQAADSNTLESYLIFPVQRVPRYLLLLAEFEKRLEGGEKSSIQSFVLSDVQEAANRIKKIAENINMSLNEKQANDKVADLDANFERDDRYFPLVAPNRRLIKEGVMKKKLKFGSAGLSRSKVYSFFLFSDILLYASASKNAFSRGISYKLKHAFPLTEIAEIVQQNKSDKNNELLIKAGDKTIFCTAENESERDDWIRKIKEMIKRQQQGDTITLRSYDGTESKSINLNDRKTSKIAQMMGTDAPIAAASPRGLPTKKMSMFHSHMVAAHR
jgi:hypothetical protein